MSCGHGDGCGTQLPDVNTALSMSAPDDVMELPVVVRFDDVSVFYDVDNISVS